MFIGLLKTMRPKQWTKNAAIFAALVFDGQFFDPAAFGKTLAGFFLLCLISGTVYIINDLVDIDKDQNHPTKKYRPLPSGQVSKQAALGLAIGLPILILPLSFWLAPGFGMLMSSYLLLQLAYSFKLKHIAIIDVMTIAAGFVLRVGAGVTLIEVSRFSPWLYVVTTLLALMLGLGKRRQELVMLENGVKNTRAILEAYTLNFLDQAILLVSTGVVMAYSLYTFSAENMPDNHLMMITIAFVIYGIFRYLYNLHVLNGEGDPSELLLTDRPMQVTVVLWGLVAMAILYLS